ncbi:MAG: hypothetical protein QM503_07240 [Bacteroidota bacterium]
MKKQIAFVFIITFIIGIQQLSSQVYSSTVNLGQKTLAIREIRRDAITGNIGWNSLTGIGISYHHYLGKQLGIEAGVGLASTGIKFGGRFSYLFSHKNFSPFVSAGFLYGLGSGNTQVDYEFDGNLFKYTVSSSPYAQIGGGIEYINNNGFMFSAILGYAILLKNSNYEIIPGTGTPTDDDIRVLDILYGSGLVMEFTIGYAFGGKNIK